MDAETRAFLEKYFGLIQQELERTNVLLRAIEDRVGALENRMGALENRMGALENRMGALENRVGALENRMGVLEDRSGSHEQAIESLRIEMRERFISTDEQIRTLTTRMQQFEGRVEDALATISRDVIAVPARTWATLRCG